MRVIIAGGRDFKDYKLLKFSVGIFLSQICPPSEIELVSGLASGADDLGYKFSKENGYNVEPFPADWNDFSKPCKIKRTKKGKKYNALAGFKRNELMAEYSDALIAFWDGKSSGTKDMIDRAVTHKLILKIVRY